MSATNLDEAIYQYLVSQTAISDLVGTRVYPDMLPEGCEFPAMTFQQVSLTARYSHDGDASLDTARVQLDVYAEDRAAAGQIASALRGVLSGARTSEGSVLIQSVFLAGTPLVGYDQGVKKWRRTIDYTFTFRS